MNEFTKKDNNMNNKLRDDMNFLHGQIAAVGFMVDGYQSHLMESIQEQYEKIMTQVLLPMTGFQALHPCNHQWKQVTPHEFMCAKCGERGE